MLNGEYKIEETKRSGYKIAGLILLLLAVVAVVALIYFFTKINRGASEESFPIAFTVPKGASSSLIAKQLSDEKVIRNPNIFLIYTVATNASGKIQAGDYMLDRKMSIVEIVDVLTAGKITNSNKKVTIVEGLSNKQIASSIEKRGIDTAQNFLVQTQKTFEFKFNSSAQTNNYEGYLFPDTYEISKDGGSEELIREALKNFESKITDKMLSDIQARNLTLKDVITMASLIEREVGRSSNVELTKDVIDLMQRERELVSSVFYNRLEIGMALQSDATVNYVSGRSDRRARAEDLTLDSPYNTYKYRGLPPGPISNPGLDSILAAIYPAQSDFLYFLNSPAGVAYFARTIEEHNSNRVKYLE
ncbi:MAG TPA: endolytic transglycosylase MltG [Verrucomicrobiae bacterium]|nr:endolytic transglycosylase MltG [Verrucomicrobiae bacterium]